MNALYGLAILATVVHGVIFDGSFWKIYGCVFISYLIFILATMNWKENPKRKILMAATWNEPSNPTSFIVEDLNVTKALAYVKKLNE